MTVMHSKGETPDTTDAPNCTTELSLEDVKQELYSRHHPSLTFLDIEAHAKDHSQDTDPETETQRCDARSQLYGAIGFWTF